MTDKRIWLGLAVSLLSAPLAFADSPAEGKADCAVAEFTMGLRFQQQSAEVQALQLQRLQHRHGEARQGSGCGQGSVEAGHRHRPR